MSKAKHHQLKFKLTTGKDLYNEQLPPMKYLIDTYLIEESLVYYAGPPGSFKTGFLIQSALCGATGKNLMGEFSVNKRFKTLFIDEENGKRRTKSKFDRITDGLDIDVNKELNGDDIVFANISGFKISKEWAKKLEEYIKKFNPDLIVIDNIARCLVGSERDERDVANIHSLLKPLIEKYGVTIVIIHHCRKKDEKNTPRTLEDLSGSRDFGGQCDEAFLLDVYKKSDDETKIFKLIQLKRKDGLEHKPINFKVIGNIDTDPPSSLTIEFDGYIEDNIEERKNKNFEHRKNMVLAWIHENQMETYVISEIIDDLQKLCDCSENPIRQVLYKSENSLDSDGVIDYKRGKFTVVGGKK